MIKEKEITIIEKDYLNDLKKIKATIRTNQNKAMVVVNSTMIMTYYEIGTIINQRKVWGYTFVIKLSQELKEFGVGFSKENLYRMSRFANEITMNEIVSQPVTQIPWFTLIEIMTKSKHHDEILWYINQTHKNSWSRSMVLNQFKLKAYERSLIEPETSPVISSSNELTTELFKDTYVFDFIDINSIKTEKELQNSLLYLTFLPKTKNTSKVDLIISRS